MTNRDVLVRLRLDPSSFIAGSKAAAAAAKDLHNQIDKSNDRTAWLAQSILALAPAAVRMGAGAVPVISGLATQMTVAVAAAGTMALAFNGVGDALGALNDYQLEPSAANMEKLALAMDKIGPAGEELVRTLDALGPTFATLANTARGEMFPGVIEGIESFMELAPKFNVIVGQIGEGIGQLASEAGAGLSGDRFADFFNYLEVEAKPILIDMGRTMGNFADGLLNMLVAFHPLSADFSSGLLDMSRAFVTWSDNLESSKGFQDFVAYVQEAGPQTLDFLGSLVTALVALATALAPLGELSLTGLTAAVDTIAALANTPLGPIALGFLSLTAAWGRLNAVAAITGSGIMSRAARGITGPVKAAKDAVPSIREFGTAMAFAGQGAQFQSDKTKAAMSSVSAFGKAAAPVAGQVGLLTLAMSDLDDKAGLTNTTTLALAGSLAGPWGAAIGAGAGLALDLKAANDAMNDSLARTADIIRSGTLDERRAELERLREEIEEFEGHEFAGDGGEGFFGDLQGELALLGDMFTGANDKRKQFEAELEGMKGTRGLGELYAQGLAMTGDAFEVAAQSADEFRQSLIRVNSTLEGRASLRDYQAALDDFTKSVKDNGRSLDIGTEKGRNNQAALDNIAASALAAAEGLKGMNRVRFLNQARQDFVNAAMELGRTRGQARALADDLGLLNRTKAKPEVDADTKPAKKKLKEVSDGLELWDAAKAEALVEADGQQALLTLLGVTAQLNALDGKTATTYVRTVTSHSLQDTKLRADGGTADGWTVPDSGKGYADRFLYMLADREEVISNRRGQADKHRPVLKAINADMPPAVIKAMLAGGGTTGESERERQKRLAEERREREEEAKDRARERREREEEKRQRRLDAQRTRDLLASDLRDEAQQENLEVQDSRRRLRSARKAGRPQREINEARLELKGDRATRAESREQRQQSAADEAWDKAVQAYEAQVEAYEAALEHQKRTQEAVLDGQQAAVDKLMEAAETQLSSAKETAREWAVAMERTGASATAGFRSSMFSDSAAARQSGLSVGPNKQPGDGWRSALTGDISGLNERSALIAQLKAVGLSGSAMEALLAEGSNEDVRGMIARGEIAEYAKLFAARESLQGTVAAQAGSAAYGAQASAANAVVASVENQIVALQARLAEIAAQRPISVYEAVSAEATAAEVARQLANAGAV